MIRTLVIIGALVSLGACASTNPHDNFVLDDAEFMEAVYLADDPNGEPLIIERIEPLAMAGQLKPLTESPIAAVPELKARSRAGRI